MDLTADTGGLLFSLSSLWAVAGVAADVHHPVATTVAATTTAVAITTVAVAAKSPSDNPLVESIPLYKGIFLFTA